MESKELNTVSIYEKATGKCKGEVQKENNCPKAWKGKGFNKRCYQFNEDGHFAKCQNYLPRKSACFKFQRDIILLATEQREYKTKHISK